MTDGQARLPLDPEPWVDIFGERCAERHPYLAGAPQFADIFLPLAGYSKERSDYAPFGRTDPSR